MLKRASEQQADHPSFLDTERKRELYISSRSIDVRAVLTARAALRTIPTISLAVTDGRGRFSRQLRILGLFRAVEAAWGWSALTNRRDELELMAKDTVAQLGRNWLSTQETCAFAAVMAVLPRDDAIPRAVTCLNYALNAADVLGKRVFDFSLNAIQVDAELIEQKFSPVTIACSQLWPGPVPDEISVGWEKLKGALRQVDREWTSYTAWYDRKVAGNLSADDYGFAHGPNLRDVALEITPNGLKPTRDMSEPTDLGNFVLEARGEVAESDTQTRSDAAHIAVNQVQASAAAVAKGDASAPPAASIIGKQEARPDHPQSIMISGRQPTATAGSRPVQAKTTAGQAVLNDQLGVTLAGLTLIASLDARIADLKDRRSNSDDAYALIAELEDLRNRVEAFLAAADAFAKREGEEDKVVITRLSFVDAMKNVWARRHLVAADVVLLGTATMFCHFTDPTSVAVAGTIVGGKKVVDALSAAVKLAKSAKE